MSKPVSVRVSLESYQLLKSIAGKLGKSPYETARIAMIAGIRLMLFEETLISLVRELVKLDPTLRKRLIKAIKEAQEETL